ncbi:MAG: hypothetical protein CSA52_03790 [Gammaproteobacteria bacterium]|nr:MAG: hypothetical protein CSB48_10510 [Pseudomonadota bacterium]PIE38002.1 MAG: hypothetical protein CSA52_03790 [Gammaproteobacteria bacterium]
MFQSIRKKQQKAPVNTRFAAVGLVVVTIFWSTFSSAQAKKVTIMDRGLNMPISTVTLPEGWELTQDIAFNAVSGRYSRYQFELRDSHGGTSFTSLRLQSVNYGPFFRMVSQGLPLEQLWKKVVYQELQQRNIVNVRFGEPSSQGDWVSEQVESMRKVIAQNREKFSGLPAMRFFEAEIHGQRNGQNYQGRAFITVMPFSQQDGTAKISLVLAPSERFSKALAGFRQIKPEGNPDYVGVTARLIDNVTRQNQLAHQRRMADQRRNFNAHQNMVRQRSAQQDANFQQWMSDFRNDGTTPSAGGSYTGQDYLVDSIHEQQTFYDPDSGYNVSRDGQYDYNYTDGMGNYYGTDNPSFNPHSLPGDWQQTYPLAPNY